MATRKQRRRREKEKRHEYEIVYLDSSQAEGTYLANNRVIGNYANNLQSGDAIVNANAIVMTQVSNSIVANNVATQSPDPMPRLLKASAQRRPN